MDSGQSPVDSYQYDANGNMTCRVEQGVTFKQVYNAENRIASIARLASGDCTTPGNYAAKWDFSYDGDGVRTNTLVTPYVNGLPQPAQLTSYFFGGAYEVTGSNVRKYYSFAGQMVAMRDGTGLKYLLTDHLGSIVAVTAANGTLITQQRYLPFGGERTDVPSPQSAGTDYGYTGQRDLGDELGLMDYRARFYSSALGRFIQPDSIVPNAADPQAFNRYSYVTNRPVNFNDPTGHCPEEMAECRKILYDLLPKPKPRGGGGNPGGNGGLDPEEYTYHLHSDTNLYELGWQNFGSAWSIGTNPNTSIGQKLLAAEYMGAWGGAHVALIYGLIESALWQVALPCIRSAACRWITGAAGGVGPAGGAGTETGRVVLSGHGEYDPANGTITIPEGTTLHTYARLGEPITDKLGNAIETGVVNSGKYIFGPGVQAPNLTLLPPYGPDLEIMGNPITVNSPTLLSDLLAPNMGNVHWAACLVIAEC